MIKQWFKYFGYTILAAIIGYGPVVLSIELSNGYWLLLWFVLIPTVTLLIDKFDK